MEIITTDRWSAYAGVISPVGADETTSASETTDETTAQQEGAGQNPARFAANALQGGRAERVLCMPWIPLREVAALPRSGWRDAAVAVLT